jgi:probable HAF family extracellular repeat protein
MMSYRSQIFILVALLSFPTSATVAIGPYVVTNLGDLPGGDDFSEAYGINSYGQVVGFSRITGTEHAFLWTPNSPNGTTGSMIDLGDLPGGIDESQAFGINAQGQVAGNGSAATGTRGYLWTPTAPNGTTGSMTNLGDLPGGTNFSAAGGINSQGQTVGYTGATTGTRAFLWTPTIPNGASGSMIDLGELPGGDDESVAGAINSFGQVIGYSEAAPGNVGQRAFLWTPTAPNGTTGSMINLGALPGGSFSEGDGINSFGQVVGLSSSPDGQRAFLWTPTTPNGTAGSMINLGDLPGGIDASRARAINSQGDVVGLSHSIGQRAFLWKPLTSNGTTGAMLDLNTLMEPLSGAGWLLNQANSINDRGQIVGNGVFDADGPGGAAGVRRAFLLTPIPEPSTAVLIAIGTMALIARRRIRM